MITFAKFKESSIGKAGRRILKVFEFGAKTAKECAPFGIDANPNLADMTAIYARTSNNAENVIIGYIQKDQLAAPGELRLFSLDENKALSSTIWLRNDKTVELNGDAHTAVRYAPLNSALQQERIAINAEYAAIAAAITALGGTYVPTPVSIDISGAESPDVKLK